MKNMYPFKLKPIYVKTVWGNDELTALRHQQGIIGSSWEISAHQHADNVILNGPYKDHTLSQMLEKFPEEMLGTKDRSQMLRISYMDASQSLSIQVHPTDEYAHLYENDEGKAEAWYVLKAKPDARLIAGTTTEDIEVLKKAVQDDKIEEYVHRIPMREGDFITIEAGQLHAFGAGMLGLEISQNSDVTYRFYDFHRKDANGQERPLHLKKSFDVVNLSHRGQKLANPFVNGQRKILERKKEFTVELIDLDGEYILEPNGERFYCLSNVLEDCELICQDQKYPVTYTENIFIPASCPKIMIKGHTRLLLSYVE